MNIMIDTNIIVSAILFPESIIAKTFKHIANNYHLVLSQYTIDAMENVFKEKFPHKLTEMKQFLKQVPYELFILNKAENKKYPKIRDDKDLPVLMNAIESRVDLLITGDKDFEDVITEKPKIMKPREYINKYMNELI
jgi:putative PIN family toxin of toxin-antitoxin system